METTIDVEKARKVRDWFVGQVMRSVPGADPVLAREIVTERLCSKLGEQGLLAAISRLDAGVV